MQFLLLPNVTNETSGWYSCGVSNEQGHTYSSGLVTVVEVGQLAEAVGQEWDAEATKSTLLDDDKLVLIYVGIGVVAVLLVLVVVILMTAAKLRKERQKKDLVHEAFLQVYDWTKKVIVERKSREDGSVVEPQVTIEKKK